MNLKKFARDLAILSKDASLDLATMRRFFQTVIRSCSVQNHNDRRLLDKIRPIAVTLKLDMDAIAQQMQNELNRSVSEIENQIKDLKESVK